MVFSGKWDRLQDGIETLQAPEDPHHLEIPAQIRQSRPNSGLGLSHFAGKSL
jgi:hypothetical protein